MTNNFPRGGFNQNHTNKPNAGNKRSWLKKIKQKPNPSVSFSHGLLGDNFDFAYLNSNGERTEELVHYWHNPSENITKEFKKFIGNYKSPIGYASWKWVINWLCQFHTGGMLKELATSLASKEEEDQYKLSTIEQTILLSSSLLCSNLQPIYLTRAITEDLARTDFKGFDAPPNDIYPVYTFMLPKTSISNSIHYMKEEEGVEVRDDFYTIIVISHQHYRRTLENWITKPDHLKVNKGLKKVLDKNSYPPADPRLNIFEAGFKMIALSNQAGWYVGDFIWKEGTKDWQIIVSDQNVNFDYDETKPVEEQLPKNINNGTTFIKMKDAPNEAIAKNLLNIAANSILLMDHQPEYITQHSPLLGGRGFKDSNPPKPSTWLGEHYEGQKIRYEYPADYIPSEGKSPRSHWRRGHMRHICQGKGRKQRVLTWIKPVFIVGRGVD